MGAAGVNYQVSPELFSPRLAPSGGGGCGHGGTAIYSGAPHPTHQPPLMKPLIRWITPWGPAEVETDRAFFSTEAPEEDAAALVCQWEPTDDLLTFSGPSAWYSCEPRTNPRIGVLSHPTHRRFAELLRPEQMLHHAHPDARYRVPHVTHDSSRTASHGGPREPKAVAVVSNFGGPIHNRGPGILLRNAFITAPGVALFGRRDKWRWYRPTRLSWWSTPPSYAGEVDEYLAKHSLSEEGLSSKIALLTRFDVAICLENTVEPWYFSEKFVDAVRAGCIPVYQAHATVRDGVLRGAVWVDPSDFDLDVSRTLSHALTLDRAEVAEKNRAWLESEAVRATRWDRVWNRIAEAVLQ